MTVVYSGSEFRIYSRQRFKFVTECSFEMCTPEVGLPRAIGLHKMLHILWRETLEFEIALDEGLLCLEYGFQS